MAKDTRVVFRKFEDGEIIALFPDTLTPAAHLVWLLDSYMHQGQHSVASTNIVETTKLANEAEYGSLLKELVSIGYDNLRITTKLNTRKN